MLFIENTQHDPTYVVYGAKLAPQNPSTSEVHTTAVSTAVNKTHRQRSLVELGAGAVAAAALPPQSFGVGVHGCPCQQLISLVAAAGRGRRCSRRFHSWSYKYYCCGCSGATPGGLGAGYREVVRTAVIACDVCSREDHENRSGHKCPLCTTSPNMPNLVTAQPPTRNN